MWFHLRGDVVLRCPRQQKIDLHREARASVGLSLMRTDASNGTRYADILRTTEERLLDSLSVRDFFRSPAAM